MIGRLRGVLVAKAPPWIMLEAGGVGYELEVPMSTLYDLPEQGREVTLFVHYAHKEDTVALYGFLREAERAQFRNLLRVSGVGARIALSILSGTSVEEFARLVQAGDIGALTRVPGIGRKTAERIVVELRDRVATTGAVLPGSAAVPRDAQSEALTALQQLGYKPAEAQRLIRETRTPGDSAEILIRKALKAALGGGN